MERMDFNPDRYLHENPAAGEKFAYVPFGAGDSFTHSFILYETLQKILVSYSDFCINIKSLMADCLKAVWRRYSNQFHI